MRPRSLSFPLLAALLAVVPAPSALAGTLAVVAEATFTETERAWLERGEAVVRMAPANDEKIGEGVAWRIVAAPADRLYRAMADWGHYAEFFPFVVASEVAIDGAGRTVVRQRVDLPFPWPDRRFAAVTKAAVEDPALRPFGRLRGSQAQGSPVDRAAVGRRWRVAWELLPGSGNVRAHRGAWRLTALGPDRTLVELRLRSDAGPSVPGSVQRRAVEQTLPWALDGLRQHVNRCRYDLPIHPSCREAPPWPAAAPDRGSGSDNLLP